MTFDNVFYTVAVTVLIFGLIKKIRWTPEKEEAQQMKIQETLRALRACRDNEE